MPEDKSLTDQEIIDAVKTESLNKFLEMLRTPEAEKIIINVFTEAMEQGDRTLRNVLSGFWPRLERSS